MRKTTIDWRSSCTSCRRRWLSNRLHYLFSKLIFYTLAFSFAALAGLLNGLPVVRFVQTLLLLCCPLVFKFPWFAALTPPWVPVYTTADANEETRLTPSNSACVHVPAVWK